jgi:hypothetical protein
MLRIEHSHTVYQLHCIIDSSEDVDLPLYDINAAYLNRLHGTEFDHRANSVGHLLLFT